MSNTILKALAATPTTASPVPSGRAIEASVRHRVAVFLNTAAVVRPIEFGGTKLAQGEVCLVKLLFPLIDLAGIAEPF